MFQDYARSPVPLDKTVSGWQIGLIYIGVGLALPAFIIGATVGHNLGFKDGMLATFLAGLILTTVALFTGYIGAKVRLSTYYLCQLAFGQLGGKTMSFIFTITMFGWFGVTINLFANAVHSSMPISFMNEMRWSLVGAFLMISTAVWGFKGLDKLSLFAVPFLVGSLGYIGYQAFQVPNAAYLLTQSGTGEIPFGVIVSILAGSWMVGAAVLPDLSRYARTPLAGSFGGFLCFVPGYMTIIGLSMLPVIMTGEPDMIKTMLSLGVPALTLATIVLAAWSSNDNNLYASALGLASIIPSVPKWIITIVAGVIGTTLGMLGIMDNFITFLVFLGVFMPPIAGVYVVDYFMNVKNYTAEAVKTLPYIKYRSVFAWAAGSFVAYATTPIASNGLELWTLSTISAVDGLVTAAVSMFILNKIFKTS